MSTSFFEDLWSSIFTPGPTPTLLVATNATFAALQLVLFILLIATYSVHFVALSCISGALWWSINWFAKEVREVQAQQKQEAEEQQKKLAENSDDSAETDNNDSDTETETGGVSKTRRRKVNQLSKEASTTAATAVESEDSEGNVLRKRESRGENSGYASTDSEWEKVDKDKSS
ncbi:ER protein Pkr1-domain-containing protein [Talaromyces proteolyticus]|uniref:ER protein Pkr1-domain-containing protein n=1 Tax=Talaromyces proteolyticus TaxID=1131652 RepID=A0AAD4Q5Z1_9EURO|nr:ER protein Pkr1-domain-containing protein [Talaromyces proteolyticus]KAH8704832.1 ER protein Pkr1-domain-containing protein [Talaromyces proteolyticus]